MKTFICILFSLFSLNSYSQIVPKSRFVGGSVAASYTKRSLQNLEEFNTRIRPEFGKFLSDKWSIQGGFNYQFQSLVLKEEFYATTEFKSRTNAVGITIGSTRFFPISDQFYFTLTASASGDLAFKQNIEPSAPTEARVPFKIGAGPGFTYFIHPKWMLQANFGALQFSSNFNNLTNPDISIGFNFSTTTSGIGIRYVIQPKR